MSEIYDEEYLNAPDNEAVKFSLCCDCGEPIYRGETYYSVEGFHYCEGCGDAEFKKIAGDE